jgi:hypothetical protein
VFEYCIKNIYTGETEIIRGFDFADACYNHKIDAESVDIIWSKLAGEEEMRII